MMNKKIIDIIPPQERKIEVRESKERKKSTFPKKERKISKKFFGVGVLVVLTLFFFGIQFFEARVEIEIYPKAKEFHFKKRIRVDKNETSVDFKKSVLPGKIVEIEKTVSGEFPATGKILKKAEGIIRLYNNYTTRTEIWRKQTRFVSADGKLFLSKERIVVPGAKIKNGKLQPSFVDVPVIAAKPGKEYNIGPSHFSIAAYIGTPRYTKFYGKSFQPMKGGGEFPQVTKEDIEKAKEVLKERAKEKAQKDLNKHLELNFIALNDALEPQTITDESGVKPGVEIEKFMAKIKVKFKTLSFKKEDLERFIFSDLSKDREVDEKSIKTEYTLESKDLTQGWANIFLKASAKTYSKIDVNSLKKMLAGTSVKESRILLFQEPTIQRVKIKVFPFYLHSLPKDLNRIKIIIKK